MTAKPYASAAAHGHYSEAGFWKKMTGFAARLGRKGLFYALCLWLVLRKPDVPAHVKGVVLGALAYFISPLDALPDILPVVGLTDDMATFTAAVAYAYMYIDEDIKARAEKLVSVIFGPAA